MIITTRYPSQCPECQDPVPVAALAWWDRGSKTVYHPECVGEELRPVSDRTIDFDGSSFIVKHGDNAEINNAIKLDVPTSHYDKDQQAWIANATPLSGLALRRIANDYQFSFSAEALKHTARLVERAHENIHHSKSTTWSLQESGLLDQLRGFGGGGLEPYPFQYGGIAFGAEHKRVIIGDKPGLGKTVEGLGIMHIADVPFGVVVPSIVKVQWYRMIMKWMPYMRHNQVVILQSRSPVTIPREVKALIINWDILDAWKEQLKRWSAKAEKGWIFDEIHYAKSDQSKRGRAALDISKEIEWIVGLSGTPFLNRPSEIIHPLRIIRKLDDLGGFNAFVHRYCEAYMEVWHGRRVLNIRGANLAALPELNERLRASGAYISRRKEDVLPDLPGKTRDFWPIDIDNREEYNRAEMDLAKWLGEQAANDEAFIASISHLPLNVQRAAKRQRAETEEIKKRPMVRLLKFNYLKQLAGEGKKATLIQGIKEFMETGEKLVVFAYHKKIQQALVEAFPEAAKSLSPAEKFQADRDRFQEDPDTKLIICSLKSTREGADLFAAHDSLVCEFGWSPTEHDQNEGRLDRIGQKSAMLFRYAVAIDTIDEELAAIIDGKRIIVSAASDGILSAEQMGVQNALITHLLAKYKEKLNEHSGIN